MIGTPSTYSPSKSLHGRVAIKKGEYWLAEYINKTLVASLRVEKYGDTYVIREVMVDPEHRGTGLGRKIMTEIIAFLKPKGKDILLYVDPLNVIAKKLYTSLGFKLIKKGTRFGDKYQLE